MMKAFLRSVVFFSALLPAAASAEQPHPTQMGFQPPASPIMEEIEWFHNVFLMPIITLIMVFVLALLLFCMIRFNERMNPKPSKTSHNTPLEIIWTLIPALILIVIAVPSFRLLAEQTDIPPPELTIKAIGHQWYWSYEYPDHALEFIANLVPADELKDGQIRLLSTDNPVFVPVNTNVRIIITSSDVIHAWALPAFGVKMDAVPGRLNETWFRATRTGVFYGQCSELCGTRHAYMPIEVHVLSQDAFQKWLLGAKKEFALTGAMGEES